jgi:hypothetical protein
MKFRTLLPAFTLILGMALGAASHARADYTLWAPIESGNQTLFSFNLTPQTCTMNAGLYINVPGDPQGINSPGNALLLQMNAGVTYSASDFSIQQQVDGTYNVYNTTNAASPQFLLSLGYSDNFVLYYNYYGSGISQVTYSEQTYDQWLLSNVANPTCNPVLLTDAAPVPEVGSATPIPGAFLLFGSGLAGVFGFRRRLSI